MDYSFDTIQCTVNAGVMRATIDNPPMNLLGPELVRDLVALVKGLEHNDETHIVIFRSADPDFFIPHVDLHRVPEYTKIAATIGGPASGALGGLLRAISDLRQITIAEVNGRARGAGSEFVLACDMCFASRENAVFCQMEVALGNLAGAGGLQHLTRRLGRARAMEALLSGEDFDADLAERYGWINRAMAQDALSPFVDQLAERLAKFPFAALTTTKRRINDIALSPVADVRTDAAMFQQLMKDPRVVARITELGTMGIQERSDLELNLGKYLGGLKS